MDGDYDKGEVAIARANDDYVMPFQLEGSGARGRLIRLGSVVQDVTAKHDYPEEVLLLLGEAVTLTAMLGAALKFDGKFILQTQSDGVVGFLVVHYTTPGHIRGYASHTGGLTALDTGKTGKPALGNGHLAMTIDGGPGKERYQGIVALTGTSLVDAAHEYFDKSEQIPTFIRIAVARQFIGATKSAPARWSWRGGGLMVQKLSGEGGRPAGDEVLPPMYDSDPEDDDGWRRAKALAATVEDHELLDPTLEPERLLYRLFHEENVRAFDVSPIDSVCGCSREGVEQMLGRFSTAEIADMAEGEFITVKCEFCNTSYRFDPRQYLDAGSPSSGK